QSTIYKLALPLADSWFKQDGFGHEESRQSSVRCPYTILWIGVPNFGLLQLVFL
ncbi:hypothetical protein Ancab_010605, partial [Ancistrocladus abbreviatus]